VALEGWHYGFLTGRGLIGKLVLTIEVRRGKCTAFAVGPQSQTNSFFRLDTLNRDFRFSREEKNLGKIILAAMGLFARVPYM
jgi:hypothetical protein